MEFTDILLYLISSVVVLILFLCIFILRNQSKQSNNDYDSKREINELKFYQQTQFLNIGKSITEDLGNLRESIILNINRYNEQTIKEFMNFNYKINNELYQFKENIQKEMLSLFDKINNSLSDNLEKINERVEFRLNDGFEKTSKTFNNILERIGKIDEAQRKIESLSTNIISLQDILTDKKTRGTFGEIQLKQILFSIFGDNNCKIYELQYRLSNNKICDAILYTPQPLGNICIDSKFPLENYKRMVDKNSVNTEIEKLFKQDVKNHIDAIKDKYIIQSETADSAIMFIPAEAIFAEINAYYPDIIEYAGRSHVWIASPTTLMFLLTTVQVILRNIERDKYSAVIHEELNKLGVEFKRYKERWDKLSKNIDQVSRNVKELHTTSDKIERQFESLSRADIKVDYHEITYNKEE